MQQMLNLRLCEDVKYEIDVKKVKVRFKLPKHILKDRSPWDKVMFFFQILDYPNDTDRMGIIAVKDVSNAWYADKTIEFMQESSMSDNYKKHIDIIFDTIIYGKYNQIGYKKIISYDSVYKEKKIEASLVFKKYKIYQGEIYLKQIIRDSSDLNNDWMDCVFKSFEDY